MNKTIRLIDRSRTVQDWKCPRARYWGYEYLGRGIVKQGTSLELFIGIVTHDALAAIATLFLNSQPIDIDEIARAAFSQIHEELVVAAGANSSFDDRDFAIEQASLTEGMIRGFYKHVWPKLMAQYDIVTVEQEMEYSLADGFLFMTKPDLIVEDKTTKDLVYIEYKTTSSKKDEWINSWDTAVQLHSSIKATEQSLGRLPAFVQIIGLYKGWESYGKQSSPFCYAYKKFGNPPFTQDQIQYEYKAGFKRFATWELPGGVKAWVESMPDAVLANQFPQTAPIMVNEELVERFFQQRLGRETEIRDYHIALALKEREETLGEDWGGEDMEKALDSTFPQRFDQCTPSFGKGCQFKKICHGSVRDPFKEGYEQRIPHHELELDQMNAKDDHAQ